MGNLLAVIAPGEIGVLEFLGEFQRILPPGPHCIMPCSTVLTASIRLQKMCAEVESRTKDGIFVRITISIQLGISSKNAQTAIYLAADPQYLIDFYVADSIQKQVPLMPLSEVFKSRVEITKTVKERLIKGMQLYGFNIYQVRVADIFLDEGVKEVLNKISLLRVAAEEKAKENKLVMVKKAEAQVIISGVAKPICEAEARWPVSRSTEKIAEKGRERLTGGVQEELGFHIHELPVVGVPLDECVVQKLNPFSEAEAEEAVVDMDGAGLLSAGGWHSVCLDAACALRAWGRNDYRQAFCLPPGEKWNAVSAGEYHTLGLTHMGALHAWGSNSFDQCSVPALEQGEHWVAASAGGLHSLGLTDAGMLHAWGRNSEGQCCVPPLAAGDYWATASAGGSGPWAGHSLGLTKKGALFAWGSDEDGQCSGAPLLPPGDYWVAASAGGHHSLGLTVSGKLHAWGADNFDQCSGMPTLNEGERWAAGAISAGDWHSLALTEEGKLYAWGKRNEGQCSKPAAGPWIAVSAGAYHSLGLTLAGEVRAWGCDDFGQVSRAPKVNQG